MVVWISLNSPTPYHKIMYYPKHFFLNKYMIMITYMHIYIYIYTLHYICFFSCTLTWSYINQFYYISYSKYCITSIKKSQAGATDQTQSIPLSLRQRHQGSQDPGRVWCSGHFGFYQAQHDDLWVCTGDCMTWKHCTPVASEHIFCR